MEMNDWYMTLFVALGVYVLAVMMIRVGINRRKTDRRMYDRRVSNVHVPIERRVNQYDRRQMHRRLA